MGYLIKGAVVVAVWVFALEPGARYCFGSRYDQAKRFAASRAHATFRQLLTQSAQTDGTFAMSMPWHGEASYARKWSSGVTVPGDVDAATVRSKVVKEAMRHVDVPYVRGGEGSSGVDCSGLVVVAYRAAGIEVPHKALLLFRHGTPTALSSLHPGDLVFFRGDSGAADHVGIFAGVNRVIHASAGRGRVVVDGLDYAASTMGVTGARTFLH
jgi:cell wall-associated NlpC family hydrolase